MSDLTVQQQNELRQALREKEEALGNSRGPPALKAPLRSPQKTHYRSTDGRRSIDQISFKAPINWKEMGLDLPEGQDEDSKKQRSIMFNRVT